jgi:hypothetical protein
VTRKLSVSLCVFRAPLQLRYSMGERQSVGSNQFALLSLIGTQAGDISQE